MTSLIEVVLRIVGSLLYLLGTYSVWSIMPIKLLCEGRKAIGYQAIRWNASFVQCKQLLENDDDEPFE